MKKLSLLLGTIGSTAAWYILSNKKLRKELALAKKPEDTVKILSHYLGRDASKIAKEVHAFIHSEEVQAGVSKAKKLVGAKLSDAKSGVGGLFAKAKRAKDAAMRTTKGGGRES